MISACPNWFKSLPSIDFKVLQYVSIPVINCFMDFLQPPNSTSSVTVSFWYSFSFQTSLLTTKGVLTEGTWTMKDSDGSQLYDPNWNCMEGSVHGHTCIFWSRDFHQFLNPRLWPSRCLLLPVCPHLNMVCGHCWYCNQSYLFSHQSLEALMSGLLEAHEGRQDIFWDPRWRTVQFCFFPKKLSQRQVWYGLHKPVLVPAAVSPTPPLR